MSQSIIPKMDYTSSWQEGSSMTIPRKRFSIEKDPFESTRPKRKMGTKLGWSICSEKSLYRRSTDSVRNGWEWFAQSNKLWCNKKSITLKKMEKFQLKIRKGWLRLKRGLLKIEIKKLQKAIQVEEITAWKELKDSESKYLQRARFIKNDWSLEEEVVKLFYLWSKCSLGRHLCNPFTI